MKPLKRDVAAVFVGANIAFMGVLAAWYREFRRQEREVREWAQKYQAEADQRIISAEEEASAQVTEIIDRMRSTTEELTAQHDAAMAAMRQMNEDLVGQVADRRALFEKSLQEQHVLTEFYMESTLLLVELRTLEIPQEQAVRLIEQLYNDCVARVDREGPNGHRLPGVEIHRLRVLRLMGVDGE